MNERLRQIMAQLHNLTLYNPSIDDDPFVMELKIEQWKKLLAEFEMVFKANYVVGKRPPVK